MGEHVKLRKTERLILGQLELDSRMPFSRSGSAVRKSQQQTSYTVSSLQRKEIIKGFYTLIDYSKLGMLNFRVYFRVNYINEEKFEELLCFLIDEAHTSWIATCGGSYDLICTFFASNPSQFNKTLRSIIARFPSQLQNRMVLTTIVSRDFGRKYLFRKQSIPQEIVGGDREPEEVGKDDLIILKELSQDARKSSVELSRSTGMTPKSVIEHIKRLRERKVIRGFKPWIDHSKIGYTSTLMLVKYHNVTVEMEDELVRYLKMHSSVTRLSKTIGEWDMEIEIETPGQIEYRRVEMEVRQRFSSVIQQIESVPVYKTHKINYFPGFVIEAEG
ncbi:Lrp/AsnC family transcriptional regulator [Candidatus Woesearchaeota archaeon]|nr:Lrp/AsnC family transcriptional regulator [Candidatus Woesearchaeota archaeon]